LFDSAFSVITQIDPYTDEVVDYKVFGNNNTYNGANVKEVVEAVKQSTNEIYSV